MSQIQSFKDNDSLKNIGATTQNLSYGTQVVNSPGIAPYNVLSMNGRTLINLLGRDGNCEEVSKWGIINVSLSLDSVNKVYGNSAIKITNLSPDGIIYHPTQRMSSGKYYILLADLKNGNASSIRIRVSQSSTLMEISDSTKFNTAYVKYNPASNTQNVEIQVAGSSGQYGYVDGIRIYEISAAEYTAIDSMTSDQIVAKYPYVDDMKPIANPYIIKSGENLLPPFTEWTLHANATLIESYKLTTIATAGEQNSYIRMNLIPNVTYTFNPGSYTSNQYFGVDFYDRDNSPITSSYLDGASYVIFTVPSNTIYAILSVKNKGGTSGTFTIINPMLNLGSIDLPFKPKDSDYIYFPNVQLASTADGSVYDTLYKYNGKYWKQSNFKTMDLDGSLAWIYQGSMTGSKYVAILGLPPTVSTISMTGIKYDGKILASNGGATTDSIYSVAGTGYKDFYIIVPNADSGWDESYTPSAAEIRAYFYGWKMCEQASGQPYNGTGVKFWGARDNVFGTAWTGAVVVATVPNYPQPDMKRYGGTNYKLQYRLATATTEEVAVEGDITLHQGPNQIEVNAGIIVREQVRLQDFNGSYYVNGTGYPVKYRVVDYKAIYRTGREIIFEKFGNDNQVGYYKLTNATNIQLNSSDTYTTTYVPQDKHLLTCSPLSVKGEYVSNLKDVADLLISNQADVSARIGTLENTKSNQAQSQWVIPTLINGWANYGNQYPFISYTKDDTGLVTFRGLLVPPNAPDGTIMFILPKEYRPKYAVTFIINGAFTTSSPSEIAVRLMVFPDGGVGFVNVSGYATSGGTGWINLNNLSYFID